MLRKIKICRLENTCLSNSNANSAVPCLERRNPWLCSALLTVLALQNQDILFSQDPLRSINSTSPSTPTTQPNCLVLTNQDFILQALMVLPNLEQLIDGRSRTVQKRTQNNHSLRSQKPLLSAFMTTTFWNENALDWTGLDWTGMDWTTKKPLVEHFLWWHHLCFEPIATLILLLLTSCHYWCALFLDPRTSRTMSKESSVPCIVYLWSCSNMVQPFACQVQTQTL